MLIAFTMMQKASADLEVDIKKSQRNVRCSRTRNTVAVVENKPGVGPGPRRYVECLSLRRGMQQARHDAFLQAD